MTIRNSSMNSFRAVVIIVLSLFAGVFLPLRAENPRPGEMLRLGVLAAGTQDQMDREWQITTEYLNHEFPHHKFQITSLNFDDLMLAALHGDLDYLVIPPPALQLLRKTLECYPLLTMERSINGISTCWEGAAIVTTSGSAIRSFLDLTQTVIGVSQSEALGCWQFARLELAAAGLDVSQQMQVEFYPGDARRLMRELLSGRLSAVVLHSGDLERLVQDGVISRWDVRVLEPVEYADFPFLCSTALYPEWYLCSIPRRNSRLDAKLTAALMEFTMDSTLYSPVFTGWKRALHMENDDHGLFGRSSDSKFSR